MPQKLSVVDPWLPWPEKFIRACKSCPAGFRGILLFDCFQGFMAEIFTHAVWNANFRLKHAAVRVISLEQFRFGIVFVFSGPGQEWLGTQQGAALLVAQ